MSDKLQDIQALLAEVKPAPREPSAKARELIFKYRGSQKIILLIGVVFILVGLPFLIIFAGGLPVDILLDANLGKTHAPGRVTSKTLLSNTYINGVNPWRIEYRYQFDGSSYHGESSTTNYQLVRHLEKGAEIDLEVFGPLPAWSRYRGTSQSTFGYLGAFSILFPLVGLLLTFFAVRSNRREIKAYRLGTPVIAEKTFAGQDHSTSSNGRHPWKIEWSFTAERQTFTGSLSSMEYEDLAPWLGAEKLIVLYYPPKPRLNTLFIA